MGTDPGVTGRILARLDRRVSGEEGAGMTLEEVGGILNLTRERVRQIQHLALLRIKAGMRRATWAETPERPLNR